MHMFRVVSRRISEGMAIESGELRDSRDRLSVRYGTREATEDARRALISPAEGNLGSLELCLRCCC